MAQLDVSMYSESGNGLGRFPDGVGRKCGGDRAQSVDDAEARPIFMGSPAPERSTG